MKQFITYLYILMLGVAGAMMTACSNDDIPIEGFSDEVVLRVAPQQMYDDFNMAQSIKEQFLASEGGGYAIEVTAFVYDEAGDLVVEKKENLTTFNNKSITIGNLRTGNYTAVVVETLIHTDNAEDNDWIIDGTETLSTLKIIHNYEMVENDEGELEKEEKSHLWYSVVGKDVQEFRVEKDKGGQIDMMPKGIGTIIDCNGYNFSESFFDFYSLEVKDCPTGRFLSPQYKGSDQNYYESYNGAHIWTGRWFTFPEEGTDYWGFDVYLIDAGEITACFGLFSWLTIPSFWACPSNGTKLNLTDGSRIYAGCFYEGLENPEICDVTFVSSRKELDKWLEEERSSLIKPTYRPSKYQTSPVNSQTSVNDGFKFKSLRSNAVDLKTVGIFNESNRQTEILK